ncbi:MAG: SIS domain-containing protein, partial [Massilibacteroides sp.]|nr:SIS domain-containing protein [Massilibacteroides sp.]
MNKKDILDAAIKCLQEEADSIRNLSKDISTNFYEIIKVIINCKGKCILTGVGKSGHIAAKIAATLASTGTPSFYINPLDAYHGDLGMIDSNDIIIAISNSGNTDELVRIIPQLLQKKIILITMTSNPQSLLSKYSTFNLNVTVEKESDPLNLVPTTSTTAALA